MVRAEFWSSKSLLSDVEVLEIMRKLCACSLTTHLANFWIPTDRYTEKGSLGSSRNRSMQLVLESGPRSNSQHGWGSAWGHRLAGCIEGLMMLRI